MTPLSIGCDYQGFEFGAGYLDSVCVKGRLFDADNCDNHGNLYEPVEDIPCPICRRADAVAYWTRRNSLSGATQKQAAKSARSLVRDIRQNRGLAR